MSVYGEKNWMAYVQYIVPASMCKDGQEDLRKTRYCVKAITQTKAGEAIKKAFLRDYPTCRFGKFCDERGNKAEPKLADPP